jgi:hypothetical protein
MKTAQYPSWIGWAPNRPGAAVANEKAREALESVRREKSGTQDPGTTTKVSAQSGIRSREIKPGIYIQDLVNQSYT